MPASRDLKPLYEEQLKSMKSALVRGFEGSSMPAKPLLLCIRPCAMSSPVSPAQQDGQRG
jgi:hypothetical protein